VRGDEGVREILAEVLALLQPPLVEEHLPFAFGLGFRVWGLSRKTCTNPRRFPRHGGSRVEATSAHETKGPPMGEAW
jgi:hypothetical protein